MIVEKQASPGMPGSVASLKPETKARRVVQPPENAGWWGLVKYWLRELIWRRRYWRSQLKPTPRPENGK